MSAKDKYKWARCFCPVCRQRHIDIVDANKATTYKSGQPKAVIAVCDVCYLVGKGESAKQAYLAYKRRVGACLEPLT